ncbi:hypothetical protein [Stratiformator vulcanicus]|uniref:Uncharacterized protein n=1 Tax=Stratiformator vulcanicus TaxID=2527980 RepID=A0A517R3L4_9PLAN|nr:hypothetical protein [Stratiformator vulcanicus]QDT38482.1 hypothetical protein Pan189_28760 [Stratiformator vulcanicus]
MVYVVLQGKTQLQALESAWAGAAEYKLVIGHDLTSGLGASIYIISREYSPVLLILDGDTTNEDRLYEQKEFAEYMVRRSAADQPFEAIFAAPTVMDELQDHPDQFVAKVEEAVERLAAAAPA